METNADFLCGLVLDDGCLSYEFAADSDIECTPEGLAYTGPIIPGDGPCEVPDIDPTCSPIQFLIDECTLYAPPTPCGFEVGPESQSFDAGDWFPISDDDGEGEFYTAPFTQTITNPSDDYPACYTLNVARSVLVQIVGNEGAVEIQDAIDGETIGCPERFGIAYDDPTIVGPTAYRPFSEYCLTGSLGPGESKTLTFQVSIVADSQASADQTDPDPGDEPEPGDDPDPPSIEYRFINYRFSGRLWAMADCCDCPPDETDNCPDPETTP